MRDYVYGLFMKTTRTVNRSQAPEYAAGSKDKGYFTYTVQGLERRGTHSVEYYSHEGRAEFTTGDPTAARDGRKAAEKAAWAAARAWVRELGELVRTETELTSEREDSPEEEQERRARFEAAAARCASWPVTV